MPDYKRSPAILEMIDPEKRLILGIIQQAVSDFQHPENDPLSALDAGIFLLHAQTLADFMGWEVDHDRWERLIGDL